MHKIITYDAMKEHINHNLQCRCYGRHGDMVQISIECVDCGLDLVQISKPELYNPNATPPQEIMGEEHDSAKDENDEESFKEEFENDVIDDGFGSIWSAWCPDCKQKTMVVVRPGKCQCNNCG